MEITAQSDTQMQGKYPEKSQLSMIVAKIADFQNQEEL